MVTWGIASVTDHFAGGELGVQSDHAAIVANENEVPGVLRPFSSKGNVALLIVPVSLDELARC